MLTVRLIFVARLDSYYLVSIETKLINETGEKAKTKAHAENHIQKHITITDLPKAL